MASNQISRHRGSKNDVWLFIGIMLFVIAGPWLAEMEGETIKEMFGIILIGFWPGILMVVLWLVYDASPKKPLTSEEIIEKMEKFEEDRERSQESEREFRRLIGVR